MFFYIISYFIHCHTYSDKREHCPYINIFNYIIIVSFVNEVERITV